MHIVNLSSMLVSTLISLLHFVYHPSMCISSQHQQMSSSIWNNMTRQHFLEHCFHFVPHPRSEVSSDDCIIRTNRAGMPRSIQRPERGLHVVNEEGATEQ